MVEWQAEIEPFFEKVVSKIPAGFKASVVPMLRKAAEERCADRNSPYISKDDIMVGMFDIVPEAFKPQVIEDLTSVGIDPQRWIDLKEIKDRYKLSWDKMERAFHPGNIHFAMYVTDRCNMKCMHCGALNEDNPIREELSTEDWKKIMDNLEAGLRAKGQHATFVWFGGEPTCREDITELIKYAGDKGYYQALITNGVLFDEKFAKHCSENGMSHVFTSFESADPEKNDRIRGFKNSLEYAKKSIKNCLKYGLFSCVSTTVMHLNVDELQDIKDLALKWGAQPYFRAIVRQRNAAKNWDNIGLTQEDYKKLYHFKYDYVIEKIRNGKAGELPAYEIFEMVPFMECPLNDTEMTALEWGVGCQACRTLMGIDINGDIFPCGYPSELILGNALEDKFIDVIESKIYKDIRDRKNRKGKCGSCHHLEMCGGGCRVHAECETGDYFESFSYCWHQTDHEHTIESKE